MGNTTGANNSVDQIVPWGRSYDEYVAMFALSRDDLTSRMLGCADGPGAFNAETTRKGGCVVSVDPLYAHSADAIRRRIADATALIVENTKAHVDAYVWDTIPSIDRLVQTRLAAMEVFLQDYDQGRAGGRYLSQSLPNLSFAHGSFELALCSHYLFTYSDQLATEEHVQAIDEMTRVAKETRVFPLLDINGAPSPHLEPTIKKLSDKGYRVSVDCVPYEFQRGGNEMLRVMR